MKKTIYILVFMALIISIGKVYAYTEYKIGDEVTYNGMDFYVIKNSGSEEDSVTLLKAEPLTVEEVNQYGGVGSDNNHVNIYNASSSDSYRTAYNSNGYGGMAYYTSTNCGYGHDSNLTSSGCTTDYTQSEVKYVVDAWKNEQAPAVTEARLITSDEYLALTVVETYETPTEPGTRHVPQYDWMYNSNYQYWTSTPYRDSTSCVRYVEDYGSLSVQLVDFYKGVVRPVIILSKTLLGDKNESSADNDAEKEDNKSIKADSNTNNGEINTTVKVANTYLNSSIVILLLGFIVESTSVFIFYIIRNKKNCT